MNLLKIPLDFRLRIKPLDGDEFTMPVRQGQVGFEAAKHGPVEHFAAPLDFPHAAHPGDLDKLYGAYDLVLQNRGSIGDRGLPQEHQHYEYAYLETDIADPRIEIDDQITIEQPDGQPDALITIGDAKALTGKGGPLFIGIRSAFQVETRIEVVGRTIRWVLLDKSMAKAWTAEWKNSIGGHAGEDPLSAIWPTLPGGRSLSWRFMITTERIFLAVDPIPKMSHLEAIFPAFVDPADRPPRFNAIIDAVASGIAPRWDGTRGKFVFSDSSEDEQASFIKLYTQFAGRVLYKGVDKEGDLFDQAESFHTSVFFQGDFPWVDKHTNCHMAMIYALTGVVVDFLRRGETGKATWTWWLVCNLMQFYRYAGTNKSDNPRDKGQTSPGYEKGQDGPRGVYPMSRPTYPYAVYKDWFLNDLCVELFAAKWRDPEYAGVAVPVASEAMALRLVLQPMRNAPVAYGSRQHSWQIVNIMTAMYTPGSDQAKLAEYLDETVINFANQQDPGGGFVNEENVADMTNVFEMMLAIIAFAEAIRMGSLSPEADAVAKEALIRLWKFVQRFVHRYDDFVLMTYLYTPDERPHYYLGGAYRTNLPDTTEFTRTNAAIATGLVANLVHEGLMEDSDLPGAKKLFDDLSHNMGEFTDYRLTMTEVKGPPNPIDSNWRYVKDERDGAVEKLTVSWPNRPDQSRKFDFFNGRHVSSWQKITNNLFLWGWRICELRVILGLTKQSAKE